MSSYSIDLSHMAKHYNHKYAVEIWHKRKILLQNVLQQSQAFHFSDLSRLNTQKEIFTLDVGLGLT